MKALFKMDITKTSSLLWGHLFLFEEGKQICSLVATSGINNFQHDGAFKAIGKGLIPPYEELFIHTEGYYLPTKGIEGLFYPVLPSPMPIYGRSEIGIHYDANVPGTAGCIGIQNRSSFLKIFVPLMERACREGLKRIPLQVEYKSLEPSKIIRPVIGHENTTDEFKDKVSELCQFLGISDPTWLMACVSFETGGTFSPSIRNPLSGATGLIQFLPTTAKGLGTTTDQLAKMTQLDQLDWVEKYFQPYRNKIKNLEDCYMAIFYPAMLGKPNEAQIPLTPLGYRQNKGLDTNKDLKITKFEAAQKVRSRIL